jgi:hypothetical protein
MPTEAEAFPPNYPLPDEYLLELGRLVALASALEAQLEVLLVKLAGFDPLAGDPRGLILVRHSAFPQKLDALSALCGVLEEQFPNLRGYESVVSQVRAAQASRNRFLHNGMAVNPETGQVQMGVGSARGTLKLSVEPVSVSDIRRASSGIRAAMASLHQLVTGVARTGAA